MSSVLTIVKGPPYDVILADTLFLPPKQEKGEIFGLLSYFLLKLLQVQLVCDAKINFAKPCLPLGRERIHLNRHSLCVHLVYAASSCVHNRIVW